MDKIIVYNNQKMVNARYLFEMLKEKTDANGHFNMWFGRIVTDWHYTEGEDFFTKLLKSTGGRKKTEYYITVDMAKEICMIDKSEIGRKVRKYYIEIEKSFKKMLIRDNGKNTRLTLTDIIQASGENERMHGFAYSNYTKMLYKEMGIDYIKTKGFRESLNAEQLEVISVLENIISQYIKIGYNYKQIKEKLPVVIQTVEDKIVKLSSIKEVTE